MDTQLEQREEKGIIVFEFPEGLKTNVTIHLKEEIYKISEEFPKKNFVLDMSEVSILNSTSLGVIVACLRHVRELGGDIHIACLQPSPRRILEIIGGDSLIKSNPTVEEAINTMQSS